MIDDVKVLIIFSSAINLVMLGLLSLIFIGNVNLGSCGLVICDDEYSFESKRNEVRNNNNHEIVSINL
jgi:hypothetical protein